MERDPLGVGQHDAVEATQEASLSSGGGGGSAVGYRGGAMERQIGCAPVFSPSDRDASEKGVDMRGIRLVEREGLIVIA
jgi:hypothetical protein